MAKRSSAITQAHLDSDLPIKTIVRGNGDVFALAGQVVFQDGPGIWSRSIVSPAGSVAMVSEPWAETAADPD